MVVCQAAQMTAYAPQIIPSVGMVVDLIFVAATLMKTVQRLRCATLVHMNATKNQRKVVMLTLTVLLIHVMSLGLITPVTIVILITSVNQVKYTTWLCRAFYSINPDLLKNLLCIRKFVTC